MNTFNHNSRVAVFRSHFEAWFEKFFFEPTGPQGLAMCRIWFFGYLAWIACNTDQTAWLDLPKAFWMPIGLFRWVSWPAFSPELIQSLQWVWRISLLGCCLGLWTRGNSVISCVLTIFLIGLPHNFGKVNHGETLTILATLIFMFARSGAALSIDALIRRCFQRGSEVCPASSEYQWPVRLMQALMVTVFFAAGIAKLRGSGLAWIYSDHMLYTCLRAYYIGQNPLVPEMGAWLAQHPLLCRFIALTTIVAEVTAPLALFSRRYRWLVIPSLFAMQLGIWIVMGISFSQYLMCYLFWLPWGRAYDGIFHGTGVLACLRKQSIASPAICPTKILQSS